MPRFSCLKLWLSLALAAAASHAQPIRVLFWGGTNTATHNSRALRDTLAPVFAAHNMLLNYREAVSHSWLQADSLAGYDVAFLYTTDQTGTDLSAAQLNAFTAWINAGHVAVAFHGSTNTYLNNGSVSAGWGNLLGALFLDHGNGSSDNGGTITYWNPVHASLTGTSPPPASAGATGGAPYWDEGRRHKTFNTDTVVIACSRMNTVDTATPWIWVRPQGNGWVYYNASGHDGQSWTRPEFKTQVVQALQWGALVGGVTGLRGRQALNSLIRMQGGLLIVGDKEPYTVQIRGLSGRKEASKSDSRDNRYDLSGLPVGVYSIEVSTAGGVFRSLYLKNR